MPKNVPMYIFIIVLYPCNDLLHRDKTLRTMMCDILFERVLEIDLVK